MTDVKLIEESWRWQISNRRRQSESACHFVAWMRYTELEARGRTEGCIDVAMGWGYFETVENHHLRTLPDGTRVFYPQGPFGRRGYVVPSEEIEAAIRRSIRRFTVVFIVLIGIFSGIVGPILAEADVLSFLGALVVAGGFGWLAAALYFRPYTKALEPVRIANSPIAAWKRMGESSHLALLMGSATIVFLMSATFVVGYWTTRDSKLVVAGVVSTLVLVPLLIALSYRFRT